MLKSMFLMQKQAKILVALKDGAQSWHISSLAKAAGTTYVHTCNFLLECERKGIVQSEKHGRMKSIRLTDRGAQLAELVAGIYLYMDIDQQHASHAGTDASAAKEKPEEREREKDKERERKP